MGENRKGCSICPNECTDSEKANTSSTFEFNTYAVNRDDTAMFLTL